MSHGKQFTLYTHIAGPNGWYVPCPDPSHHPVPLHPLLAHQY